MSEYLWGKPANSQKHHIFAGAMSLCRKWMYGGADDPVESKVIDPQSRDCKACVKIFNKTRRVNAS